MVLRRPHLGLLLLLLAGGLSGTALAGDMRCNNNLVYEGLTPFEVYERCGAAVWEDARVEFLAHGVPIYVDEWLYEQGDNRFRRLLRFENGRLRDIEVRGKPRPRYPRR